MHTLIVYYSRSGTTRKIAHVLKAALEADIAEINCERYRPGALRYLRAGYDSLRGNLPRIECPAFTADEYDLVLIGAPVWTSYPAVPIRAFLKEKPNLPPKVGVFLTYGGHSPAERAVEVMAAALPVPISAVLALRSQEIEDIRFSEAIPAFIQRLA